MKLDQAKYFIVLTLLVFAISSFVFITYFDPNKYSRLYVVFDYNKIRSALDKPENFVSPFDKNFNNQVIFTEDFNYKIGVSNHPIYEFLFVNSKKSFINIYFSPIQHKNFLNWIKNGNLNYTEEEYEYAKLILKNQIIKTKLGRNDIGYYGKLVKEKKSLYKKIFIDFTNYIIPIYTAKIVNNHLTYLSKETNKLRVVCLNTKNKNKIKKAIINVQNSLEIDGESHVIKGTYLRLYSLLKTCFEQPKSFVLYDKLVNNLTAELKYMLESNITFKEEKVGYLKLIIFIISFSIIISIMIFFILKVIRENVLKY